MSFHGIPLTLENALDTLCQTNTLTSWTIKSGPRFSQVVIRFKGENMAAAEVQYRRAPPSRLLCDRQRAGNRQQNRQRPQRESEYDTTDINYNTQMDCGSGPGHPSIHHEDVPGSCSVFPQLPKNAMLEASNSRLSSTSNSEKAPDHTMTAYTDLGDSNIHREDIVKVSNTNHNGCDPVKAKADAQTTYSIAACAVNHSDQVQVDVNMVNNIGDSALDVHSNDHEMEGVNIADHGQDQDEALNMKLDMIIKRLEILDELVPKIDEDNSKDSESNKESNEDDGAVICDGCGGMMQDTVGCSWYTCSDCVDVHLCWICFDKDIHGHHKKHICKFVCPADWNTTYCDSCGLTFKGNDELYHCTQCEDYCLCVDCCLKRHMHTTHAKYLTFSNVRNYNSQVK